MRPHFHHAMEGRGGKDGDGNGKRWSDGVDHVHAVQLEAGGFRVDIGRAGDRARAGTGSCALGSVVERSRPPR